MNIAVIILTLNQRETTLHCLAALDESVAALVQRDPSACRVLLWDNGSQDNTAAAVHEAFPDVIVHYHPSNLGVASGRNEAAKLAIERFRPSHLLFLDNDMLVEPRFVESLYEPFTRDPRLGQTQAKLRFMQDPTKLNDAGGARINFLLWHVRPVGYGETDRGQYDRIAPCICCGGAMMVRADIFQALGGFDRTFDPFGPEDLDFSLRLQKRGYLALYAPSALAYHAVSHTYGSGYSESYARHKLRHWLTFTRRHATVWQQIGFAIFGAPLIATRLAWREGKRGNFGAFRGLFRGFVDAFKREPAGSHERR